MKLNKMIAAAAAGIMALAGGSACFAADYTIPVTVNGKSAFGVPVVDDGRSMVTMEEFFDQIGVSATVEGNTVIAEKNGVRLELPLGEDIIVRNGFEMPVDIGARIYDGTVVYVPLRAVAEAFGETVTWREQANDVVVSDPSSLSTEPDQFHKKYVRINTLDGRCLSSDNGLKLEEKTGEDDQVWLLVYKGAGSYAITNKADGKAPDVSSFKMDPGIAVGTYAANGGDNQQIMISLDTDGKYTIYMKHSALALTAGTDGLTQEIDTGVDSQRFDIEILGDGEVMTMGVALQPFMLKGETGVNNVKVQWNDIGSADRYDIYRSVDGMEYTYLASSSGLTYDDYGLELGKSYSYKVIAAEGGRQVDSRESESFVPYAKPDMEYKIASNLVPSGIEKPNSLYVDGVYYRFSQQDRTDGGVGFGRLVMTTSTDDVTYGNEVEVLNIEDILSHETSEGIADCKFESNNFIYNSETGMFYWWAHFEQAGGYGTARVSVAYGHPGEKFTWGGSFRPEGDDARDLNIYVDDDNKAYLITAINGNADLALYRLTEDWTDVECRLTIVNYSSWRELPSVMKRDGIYYLFSSGTAGWYPTQGMYNTATDMAGPWSELRAAGNRSTFSAQSGSVSSLVEDGNTPVMNAYRWMWFWDDSDNRVYQNRMMPVCVDNGYAFYDYFDELLYNVENNVLIPVQQGKLLSQSKPIIASGNSQNAKYINDGDYQTCWIDDEWPATVTVDLEAVYDLEEMQVSWHSRNGSEAYYHYIVEGSVDGENYELMLDRSEGYTEYGFTTNGLYGQARYVRLTVIDAKVRGTDENTYVPQIYEVKIFGEKSE